MNKRFKHEKQLILILEDEYRVAMVVAKIVRASGYQTIIARHVDAAKACFTENSKQIDVVIADYGMRGQETGLDFLNWVYAHHPNVCRVLMSGFLLDQCDSMDRYACDYFLQKPFEAHQLTQLLASVPGQINPPIATPLDNIK